MLSRGDPAAVQQPEIGRFSGSAADRDRDQRHDRETAERFILMFAAGGLALGARLALMLGNGISRPMIKMCKARASLPPAIPDVSVRLPGATMKSARWRAVEEFKIQAVAKAERDAASQEAQNKAAGVQPGAPN